MIFPSFNESPAVEALLSGVEDVDLIDVFCEAGGCDAHRIDRWASGIADCVFGRVHSVDSADGIAVATATTQLLAGETQQNGRLTAAIDGGVGWPSAVAALEQKVLLHCGIRSEILDVFGDVMLRVRAGENWLFHPVGSLSVWVEEAVAAGFLHERYGLSLHDVQDLLSRTPAKSTMQRTVATDYFERLCAAESATSIRNVLKCRRLLAAIDPGNRQRWLAVANAELIAGHAATAFRLATRLERSSVAGASAVRQAAESQLANLN